MQVQTLEPIISQHRFFQDLERTDLQFIVECAANVRFKAGEFLFHEGEAANQFYLIRHGRVALQTFIPQGGPTTFITVEAGEVLGWSWLCPPFRWYFDARAVVSTRAISFEAKCLRAKCDAEPKLGYILMQRVSRIIVQRLQATRLQLLDMYGCRASQEHR
jgi:CRP/FNR family cyclic AMP-dependent transcriptional regulator